MAFRFAVIPAGSAGSAADAECLVAAMRRAPRGSPPPAVVEALGELAGSGIGEFTVGRRTDSGGALLSVRHPLTDVLEALLILAVDHGLAVYDIRLNRLYDPAGSIPVDVVLPGLRLPFLTRNLLTDLVLRPEWPDPEAPFAILERAPENYIQVWRLESGYQLEYREGSAEFHFMCRTEDPGLVADAMWAWATGDSAWRGAVAWEPLDLAADGKPRETSVTLHNDRRGDGSLVTLEARLEPNGVLTIYGDHLGPATEFFDGECEWWYTVAAEDVPRLVVALGGEPGGEIIELLAGKFSGERAGRLEGALRGSGVAYSFYSWP